VSAEAASAATAAADLITLDGATSSTITVSAPTSVSGSVAAVKNIYVTNIANFTGLGNEAITLGDVGSRADTDLILNATTGAVTTGQLTAETYANFATGDKINTGLDFSSSATAGTIVNDTVLDYSFDASTDTLTFETVDGAGAATTVALVLTGIASVSVDAATGVFTLTHDA
jgi:hypothetical protein